MNLSCRGPSPSLQPVIPNGTEQLLPSLSGLLADVSRIESTRVAWMNVDEYEIYELLRGNITLPLFPSTHDLSKSLALVRETKEAWTTCNSNELSAFIFQILSQLTVGVLSSSGVALGLPTLERTRTEYNTIAASPSPRLILSEDEIRTLRVRDIHDQLDIHRGLWRPGMTVIPKNYLLRNKAAKLRALLNAVAEHLTNLGHGSDIDDSDTLGASSRRKSAQMLDVLELDELENDAIGREIKV
ncbi:hypothetical protein B0H13DRAFT_1880519 [Mycena leptocephala]|nr:hypothetical protein B0H13DRAFT_1880519 [Mycena leptocephala]